MATFYANQVVPPAFDQIDTTQQFDFGYRFESADKAYVYVKGVASGAAGAWVTFNPSTGVTALLTANAQGKVGIMIAALDATTKFGWIQVKGQNDIAKSDTTAANKPLYIDGTDGRVDDAVVAGDLVANAFSLAADSSNVLSVYINEPFVTDTLS